ncbi:MAG: hypothetical protein PHP79_09530 [Clostridia bacterium]|nr:hypothetical protein [Clostridia bacterium]
MKKHKENRSESEIFFLINSESATATTIGAVLLLGIIFSVLTILWVCCVPEWKNDAEYSHMGDVCEDMAKVKSKIDLMSIILASNSNPSNLNSINPSPSTPYLVMSVPFHMGGGSIPLIGPIKSSGSLAVNKENCTMRIVVTSNNSSDNYYKLINCGTITYNSQNRYFVDQDFSYENGALILGQNKQSVMMLYPSVRFSKVPDNDHNVTKYNVSINAMRIFQKPYAPPEVISSNRGCSLRLIGIDYIPLYEVGENLTKLELTVNTKYPEVWEQHFKKIANDASIVPGTDCVTEANTTESFARFTFPKENSDTKKGLKGLYISETVIKAEPGIGLN